MLEQQMTYIYSLEGKDLYNKLLEIKRNKKFKASLDYSLEAIKIHEVAHEVYKGKKEKENVFYQVEDKQYTNKVINLTFKYNVKEYNLLTLKNKKYYVHLDSNIDNKRIKDIIFINGVYIEDNKILAIEIDSKTTLKSKELPQGFGIKDNKISLTSTGIKTIANTDEIRERLYIEGFKLEFEDKKIIEYTRFKRSSGSSRVGKCLFIDKRLYKSMLEWSMMGLKFKEDEKIDLAGLEAYISLTTSSIIDTIHIEPKNILLINDYKSTFKDKVMVTNIKEETYIDDKNIEQKRDRLYTEKQDVEIANTIWDGQSLLDVSIFGEKYKDKGFLLLRNRFWKSACFNTNIQKFFKDNDITELSQLNGYTLAEKIEDIKLITTPSSIKYLKYGTKEDYFKLLEPTFGIVKYDKPTHYFNGYLVQTHYQLLNTLQLSEEDIKYFLKDSLDYVNLLKNDIRVLREHLNIKIKENIEYGEMASTDEFMFTMLQLNNKFENTDLFNTFRQDLIKAYIKNMKRGHILIHGNYSVLCGNGLEMLKYSCKDKNGKILFDETPLLNKDEVYCKNFKLDQELIGSRSPHVTMGNIWLMKNTNYEKSQIIKNYFNSSKQIIHISSIGTNVLERLSSADFDSDSLLVSDSELLIQKAKLNYNNFLVPTSNVSAQKIPRLNNAKQKSDLDIKTSKNLIGEIINCSQILNSKLWDRINKGCKVDSREIQDLYADISQLDVMSCIEIDKAKKEFSIDNQLELDSIRDKYIKYSKKPLFFKFLAKEKGNSINIKKYIKHKTSMDYLIKIIDKKTKEIRQKYRKGSNKVTTFGEIFSKDNGLSLQGVRSDRAYKVIDGYNDVNKNIYEIWNNKNTISVEKYNQVILVKNDFANFIKKLKLSVWDIKKIIYILNKTINIEPNNKKEINKRGRTLLTTLYGVYKNEFIALFEENKEPFKIIERTNEETNLKIYKINYKITQK